MPFIHRDTSVPLYEQIKIILRDQIVEGEFKPGDLLPPERELCDLYQVSRITVVRALNELAAEGFIRRIQGKGTIVASRRIEEQLNMISGFRRSVESQGFDVTSRVLSTKFIDGDEQFNETFRLPPGYRDGYLRIRRLRYADKSPVSVFTTFVTRAVGEQLLQYDLERLSFYDIYRQITGLRVTQSEVTLVPVTATPEIIQMFDVKPGTAHFWHRSVSYLEDGRPIESTSAIFRGDMVAFKSTLYAADSEAQPSSPWFIREALIPPLGS